ncbi:MAG TPA: nucleoside triphosphate pyrophosphohydrolase, partial [Syntrophales bacterium]|nr:nucleoside triphosphate pyrophosphohydrolase [Syntrophales bacterium]
MEDINVKIPEGLAKLLGIIKRLRSENGCLWDRRQKKEDMARYILEETYELVDAIAGGKPAEIKEEMGDLLFQILFLARIAEEADEFRIADVMETVGEKMIRRHPHVFGDKTVKNVDEIKHNWDDIKKNVEKKDKGKDGILENVPRSMPALMRAQKMTEAASKVGFDWENKEDVLQKIDEELCEFKSSLT